MPLIPKPTLAKASRSFASSVHAPQIGRVAAVNPTTPKVTVTVPHVRDVLHGSATARDSIKKNNWHSSNLKDMSLGKSAQMTPDAQHDLVSTGLIGAIGSVTTVLGAELAGMKPVQRATSMLGPKMRLGIVGGGLGLLGDYGALRVSRALSGTGTGEHEIKNMNKVANYQLNQLVGKALASSLLKQAEMSDATYAMVNGAAALEGRIARQYGESGPSDLKDKIKSNFKGNLRASGRGYLEGIPTAAIGATAGHFITKAFGGKGMLNTIGGGVLGALPGIVHGQHASFTNQAKEMHKKYAPAEKQAAFNELVDAGVDFDSAVNAVLSVS